MSGEFGSPKFHLYTLVRPGTNSDVSVKITVLPGCGSVGENTKLAEGGLDSASSMVFVVGIDDRPISFVTVNVTA